METDYRKLCLDLFGTDDKEQLRKIAEGVNRRNPRNAGRKKRFSASEIREMETLRDGGMSLAQIAEQYGTSRQLVGRVLTPKSPEGCSMRMIYMFKQHPCTVIDIDFLKQKIYIQNKTDDIIHRAFGVVEMISFTVHSAWSRIRPGMILNFFWRIAAFRGKEETAEASSVRWGLRTMIRCRS